MHGSVIPMTVHAAPKIVENLVDWNVASISVAKEAEGGDDYGVAVAVLISPATAKALDGDMSIEHKLDILQQALNAARIAVSGFVGIEPPEGLQD
jgi:hypothetical protein